jgi:glycosyltransferase involved in cell wall biosynthesis
MARTAEFFWDSLLNSVSAALIPIAKLAVWSHIKRADVIYNPSPVYALLTYKKIPKVFNFWDPFGFEYSAFGEGRRRELHRFMFRYYVKATAVVTQSHANRQYLEQVWKLDPKSINVVYNGSPDYGPLFQKFIDKIGFPLTRDNVLTHWPRKRVAGFTKHDALATLLSDTLNISALFRLINSLTPASKIIMISTQYRPYKGFEALFNVLDALIHAAPEYDFRFVITAELPEKIRDRFNGKFAWETERVYEMTRLSNLQHACMYSLSDVVLHPSFAEGGPTQYPASEAASVGVPSLTNLGRHTREMLARDGDSLACVVAEFLKKDETVQSILRLMRDPVAREENIRMVESSRLHWSEIGAEYGRVFEAFQKS